MLGHDPNSLEHGRCGGVAGVAPPPCRPAAPDRAGPARITTTPSGDIGAASPSAQGPLPRWSRRIGERRTRSRPPTAVPGGHNTVGCHWSEQPNRVGTQDLQGLAERAAVRAQRGGSTSNPMHACRPDTDALSCTPQKPARPLTSVRRRHDRSAVAPLQRQPGAALLSIS